MADLKTSQEIAAAPLDGTELVRIVQGASSARSTTGAIAALASALGIHAAALKTVPVDGDELPLADSAAGFALKKYTWANLKAAVWGAWGALIGAGTGKTTPADADAFALMDSAAGNATKSLTWANARATLKTFFDTLYASGTGSVTNSAGALTAHALIVGNGGNDEKALASLGTTHQVLHGNAAGDPAWGAVDLAADVTGTLPVGNLPVNVANGIAPLDSSGLVPAANLPSYVDDVLEFANLAAFPGTGATGKIYVALDTNAQYRWSGSVYIELVASPGTTDNVPEGSTNLYFTPARIASGIHAATGKTTPVDADELGIADSAASYALKRLTFANLAAWVWSKLGPLIAAGTGKTTPIDADSFAISDSAASDASKKVTLTNFKAFLKTYFDTLYGSGGGGTGPGAAAAAYAQYLAASLEPDAIEALQINTFSYAINSTTTKMLMASWATRVGASGRMEQRNPSRFTALRGVTLTGLVSGSAAILIDQTLPTYANAWNTYYTRLKAIAELPVQSVSLTAVSTSVPFLPGAYGAIIVQYTCYDFAWLALRPRGGSTIGVNLLDEVSDSATQRIGDSLAFPVSKQIAGRIESSSTGSSPLGTVAYVLLPSTWSVIADPNSYSFRDDFMGATLDTSVWTRAQSTVGNVEIDTTYQWLKFLGNSSWGTNGLYKTTTQARSNGRKLIVDVYVPVNGSVVGAGMVGWSDAGGQSYTNFAHGVNFGGSNAIQVYENGTSRGTVGTGYTDGCIYRVRITQGTSSATYEIQGGTQYPAIGSGSWTNITPGTTSSSTTPLTPGATSFGPVSGYIGDMRVIG